MAVETESWSLIESAVDALHPGETPKHWGTVMRYSEGGPDPLDGVSAYAVLDPPHWHYVTFGFSELGKKESDDPAVSGWGFELSFLLARKARDREPPLWTVGMLQTMARYVFNQSLPFGDRHYIHFGGPLTKEVPTKLCALVFVPDPRLGQITTPNGSVAFLTPVGITEAEYRVAADGDVERVVAAVIDGHGLPVTDLARPSRL